MTMKLKVFCFRSYLAKQGVTAEQAIRQYMAEAYALIQQDRRFDLTRVRVNPSNPNLLPAA
jgi:hypothetical protein